MGTTRVDVRLDDEVFETVKRFRTENGIDTPSQAIRVLIDLGLSRVDQLEPAWRKSAWAEGTRAGKAQLLAAVGAAQTR